MAYRPSFACPGTSIVVTMPTVNIIIYAWDLSANLCPGASKVVTMLVVNMPIVNIMIYAWAGK